MNRDHPAEPTATEAAAYVGIKLAEYGAYAVIFLAIAAWWCITP
jgi:hypothetical protein